jgi:hypothetical protein
LRCGPHNGRSCRMTPLTTQHRLLAPDTFFRPDDCDAVWCKSQACLAAWRLHGSNQTFGGLDAIILASSRALDLCSDSYHCPLGISVPLPFSCCTKRMASSAVGPADTTAGAAEHVRSGGFLAAAGPSRSTPFTVGLVVNHRENVVTRWLRCLGDGTCCIMTRF